MKIYQAISNLINKQKQQINIKRKTFVKLKRFCYLVLIPVIVFILAQTAVFLSCKLYWGSSYLNDFSGFALSMYVFFIFLFLTVLYYTFYLAYVLFNYFQKTPNNTSLKRNNIFWTMIFLVFILFPILWFYSTTVYDYRFTICYSAFIITYYVLFFMFKSILSKTEKLIDTKEIL